MKRTIMIVVFVLLSNMPLTITLFAQDNSNALKALQIKPKVEIIPFQTKTALGSAITFRVRVTNLTDSYIAVKKIKLVMPPEYLSAFNAEFQKEIEEKTLKESGKELDPGNEWQFIFTIPTVRNIWQVFNATYLTFAASEYEVNAIVTYRVLPGKETDIIENTKIKIEPTLSAIIVGGFVGSFILTILVGFYNYKAEIENLKILPMLLKYIFDAMKGAVSACVILLLMVRIKDLALPINISINDFFGGVVLGLLSYKLSDWLKKFLIEKFN